MDSSTTGQCPSFQPQVFPLSLFIHALDKYTYFNQTQLLCTRCKTMFSQCPYSELLLTWTFTIEVHMTKLYLLFITTYGYALWLQLNFQFRVIHFLLDEKREHDPWESDFFNFEKKNIIQNLSHSFYCFVI